MKKNLILGLVIGLLLCVSLASAKVYINELLPDYNTVYSHEWIELYNNDTAAVNLTGWTINDTKDNPKVIITIPNDRIIGPNSYLLFYLIQDQLNNAGDTIILINNFGIPIDSVSYSSNPNDDRSLGRLHDGWGILDEFDVPTPNATNNRLPTGDITAPPINEDVPDYFIITTISDPDGDALTFTIADEHVNEVNCTVIDGTNVTLSPALHWNGVTNCTIRVYDGYGAINRSFNINVKPVNDAPVFDPALEDQPIDEDSALTYDIDANDVDAGDVLSFSSNITIVGGTINASTGVLAWMPDNDDVGEHNIGVTVCDDSGATNNCVSGNFTIIVENTNDAPYFDPVLEDKSVYEDSALTYDIDANDVDAGDVLSFSSNITIVGGTINASTGVLAWMPDNDDVGEHSIEVTVCDDSEEANDCTNDSFVITVGNTNDAPVLNPIADKTAIESIPLMFTLSATDEDPTNDVLTFGTNASVGDFTLDSGTGIVTFTPEYANVGVYGILFNVSDGKGGKDEETITLTVNSALEIIDLDVTVDGNDNNNLENGAVVDARPGSAVQADIELKNMMNIDIRGVVVNGTLNTDLGLFKKSSLIPNMVPQDTNSIILQFNLPNIIGEKLYPLIIKGIGEDENHIMREVERVVYINVTQKGNEVIVEDINLTPAKVGCVKNATLRFNITNRGKYDQINGNTIRITNEDLGIGIEKPFSINKNSTSAESYPLNITTTQTGTFPLKINVTWFYVNSIPNAVNLEIVECIGVPDHSVEEDTTPSSNWIDLWSYINDPNYAPSYFTYDITQSNESLINCSVIFGQYVNCSTPAADKSGYSDINVSVTGSFTNYDVFRITVTPKNDPPAITTPTIPNITFDEGGSNSTVDLDDYVFDVDNDDSQLMWTTLGNWNITVSINPTTHIVTFATIDEDWYGEEEITFVVKDPEGLSNSDTIKVIVIQQLDDWPSIIGYNPIYDPLIGDGIEQRFNITVSDPDDILPIISWYVDGALKDSGADKLTFSWSALTDFIVKAAITNATTNNEHIWDVEVSKVPVTDDYDGTIDNVEESNVGAFSGLTIYNGNARIDFGNQTINLSDVVDIDANVRLEKGIAGIDSDATGFNVFKIPATITMYALPFTDKPKMYYNEGFSTTGTTECPSSICTDINYANGTLTFRVAHFSTFFVKINMPPKITSSPVTTAILGEEYRYEVKATDPENDPLTYSLTTKPNGMVISNSGVITWTSANVSDESVTVKVTDTVSNTDTQSFTISVREAAKLIISDLDIKVGDKTEKDLKDGDTIGKEASPGDRVKFDVELENLFSSSSDIQIEDIEVTVTIEGIDDGDDLEESVDVGDLDAGDDDSVTLEFDIPTLVDEDTYDVTIEVDGEDEKGNNQDVRWELKLNVEKEKHALLIDTASLSPSVIRCDGNPSLAIEVVNIGSEDEDDVTIEITNDEIGLNIEEKDIVLEEGNDEDSVFEKVYSLKIGDDVKPGTYQIAVRAYYDSKKSDEEAIDLVVEKCTTGGITTPVKGEPADVVTTTPTAAKPAAPSVTKISFRESSEYLTLLAILFVILFGGIIFAVGAVIITARKRRQ